MARDMHQPAESGQTVPLRCSCGTTFARLREDGALIIVSRHHGQKCVNILTVNELVRLQKESWKKK